MGRIVKSFLFVLALLSAGTASADPHQHHAKHNMVLFGESEVFASHIVYKVPHNYQVILKLSMEESAREAYLRERRAHPKAEIIFLLDHMHIGEIENAQEISGTVFRVLPEGGGKSEIVRRTRVARADFQIVYFDELPLSLAK